MKFWRRPKPEAAAKSDVVELERRLARLEQFIAANLGTIPEH